MPIPEIKIIKESDFHYILSYEYLGKPHTTHFVSAHDSIKAGELSKNITTLDGGLWTIQKGENEQESISLLNEYVQAIKNNLEKTLNSEDNSF